MCEECESVPGGGTGFSIYSLVDSTEAQYFTRPVSSVEYASYMATWRGWVTDRYRAWKSGSAAMGD